MPSKSQKQHDLMLSACHSADFAKKVGIEQAVACEFVEADKKEGLWQTKEKKASESILDKWV